MSVSLWLHQNMPLLMCETIWNQAHSFPLLIYMWVVTIEDIIVLNLYPGREKTAGGPPMAWSQRGNPSKSTICKQRDVFLTHSMSGPCAAAGNIIFIHLWDPSHKSHNASDKCPTIHHFVTEMCIHIHFCYKMVHHGIWEWCIVEFEQQVSISPNSVIAVSVSLCTLCE